MTSMLLWARKRVAMDLIKAHEMCVELRDNLGTEREEYVVRSLRLDADDVTYDSVIRRNTRIFEVKLEWESYAMDLIDRLVDDQAIKKAMLSYYAPN